MAQLLLLEPNQLLAKQVAEFLTGQGHQVQVAHDAQAAIVHTDQTTPDLVIMEVLLAGHSGIEFLYEFRSYAEWQRVPVILFSRISQQQLTASDKVLTSLGVTAFLYKPNTSLQRLQKRIEASLQTA